MEAVDSGGTVQSESSVWSPSAELRMRTGVAASPARRVAEEALSRLSERVLVVESQGPRLDDALRAIHAANTVAVDCEGIRLSRMGQLTVLQVGTSSPDLLPWPGSRRACAGNPVEHAAGLLYRLPSPYPPTTTDDCGHARQVATGHSYFVFDIQALGSVVFTGAPDRGVAGLKHILEVRRLPLPPPPLYTPG